MHVLPSDSIAAIKRCVWFFENRNLRFHWWCEKSSNARFFPQMHVGWCAMKQNFCQVNAQAAWVTNQAHQHFCDCWQLRWASFRNSFWHRMNHEEQCAHAQKHLMQMIHISKLLQGKILISCFPRGFSGWQTNVRVVIITIGWFIIVIHFFHIWIIFTCVQVKHVKRNGTHTSRHVYQLIPGAFIFQDQTGKLQISPLQKWVKKTHCDSKLVSN